FQNILVKADSELITLAILESKDGYLFIHSKKHLRHNQHIDVYVTNDSLNEIKSYAGANFKTLNKIKAYRLNIEGSEGAIYTMDGDFNSLKLNVSTGCVA